MRDDAEDAWEEYHNFRASQGTLASPSRRVRTFDATIAPERETSFPLDPFYYGNALPVPEQDSRKVELCIPPSILGTMKGQTWESEEAPTTPIPSIVESETSSNGSDPESQFEEYGQVGVDRLIYVRGSHDQVNVPVGQDRFGGRNYPQRAMERFPPVMSMNWPSPYGGVDGSRSSYDSPFGRHGTSSVPAPDQYLYPPHRPMHQYPQGNGDYRGWSTPSYSLSYHHNSQRPAKSPKLIEISPGTEVILRGADEVSHQSHTIRVVSYVCVFLTLLCVMFGNFLRSKTWKAIHVDFFSPTTCVACENDIFCIADAQFVVCPHCKTISSMDHSTRDSDIKEVYGAGLGFTFENLLKWQTDIVRSRKEQEKIGRPGGFKPYF
jgi:hypothetical protein